MPLSWNEIRTRAIAFSRDWEGESRENAEAQTFWNAFFHVFGKVRRHVAAFEAPVRSISGTRDRIDLLWPGTLIAEHKSLGKPLDKAETQAFRYVQNLISEGRQDEAPRYICVSDFATITLYDLDEDRTQTIPVDKLHEHIHAFDFIAGYERRVLDPEDPANIKAAEKLARLHDALEDGGYPKCDLERFMVRILFCLFAEDTAIFDEPRAFEQYIRDTTKPDGSDLGMHLAQWFRVLNTPRDERQKSLDERLAELPYVNGDLYADRLDFANFNTEMRTALLECCAFHWDTISPAVFGSLFQSIMEPRERRQVGAHYTSERDILKLITSLFMDELRAELEKAKSDKPRLRKLHERLGAIKILDPACGCGNFLVIAYRELRKLEIEILERLHPRVEGAITAEQRALFDVRQELRVDVDQFFGIEIDEWPARIAEVAMWLMDHQMNLEVSRIFGEPVLRLPLEKSAKILCANALRTDWNDVLPADQCSYVLGNPPFIGGKYQSKEQRKDMDDVWGKLKGAGLLDYVTCWHARATNYLKGYTGRAALVSTNSICQGEQVGVLWNELFRRGIKIDFAHRTFPWASEARGKAHVHVVIVGFGHGDGPGEKLIHDYGPKGETLGVAKVSNISPYLTDGPDRALTNITSPLCSIPRMSYGSMQNDGGHLVLTGEERQEIIEQHAEIEKYIRPFMGSTDLLNSTERWCLWLVDAEPALIRKVTLVRQRIEKVRTHRLESPRKTTQQLASTPALFGEIRQPNTEYLAIPRTSSERRDYIPLGFLSPHVIANTDLPYVPDATPFHFGILHSAMHMAWVRQVCGRLESRYRYSAKLVYNNFPWPEDVTDANRAKVEAAARAVLDARANHPGSTLADLYDPLAMPKDLREAHAGLDRAVDRCYRSQPFPDERRRFEHLFAMWERLTAPLAAPAKKKTRKKKD
ncbi:MAG: class I SAM-dependent DNA methyltransferase [Phycisphaera sp.]|nr:class I SAM-dependent DNA methyltransferase [Phycisphaera sp.]